jgi:16S rRNA (guanine966-N2)-methyltransferase
MPPRVDLISINQYYSKEQKMMRVIAGTAKGHHIKAPRGTATRPATDLVRGAIFSILETTASNWSRVLDLFSGSGALGIEALSRGAGWVDFVEHEPRCCSIIRQNLEKTKLTDQAHLYCCSVAKALSFLDQEYSIILIDPPYADTSIGELIQQLATSRLVGKRTIVVVTHSPHLPLAPAYPPLNAFKERRHGESCIILYQKEDKS